MNLIKIKVPLRFWDLLVNLENLENLIKYMMKKKQLQSYRN